MLWLSFYNIVDSLVVDDALYLFVFDGRFVYDGR